MTNANSRVTIHMVASLDGFIARRDGRVDWLETADEFAEGETLDQEFSLKTCLKFSNLSFRSVAAARAWASPLRIASCRNTEENS